MDKIRVIIIDDHRLFRKCISYTLEKNKDIEIIGQAQLGTEFLNKVKILNPHVALMGAKMNKIDIIHTTQLSREYFPNVGIIAFIFNTEKEYLDDIIKAGVHGILSKDAPLDEIVEAIRAVYNHKIYFSREIQSIM